MRLPWSHCRDILISGQGLRTRIAVPLYDIQGELQSIRQVGNELIIDYVKKSQKLNPPGLGAPVTKKDAVKARNASSIRQADSISNGEERSEFADRYD